jgi:chromosome segregation ATPase
MSCKIEIQQNLAQFHDTNDYKGKILGLKTDIKSNKMKTQEVEETIARETTKWNEMYSDMQNQMADSMQGSLDKHHIQELRTIMDKIKLVESNITVLQGEVIVGQQKQKENQITDDEVSKLKQEVQNKVTQYKVLMNDRSALFEEMYEVALIMINRDKQIIKNEEEIVQLRHEIDINILEIEQKTAIISELQDTLLRTKAEYKQLKKEIKILEEQCEKLQAILKEKEDDIANLEDVIREKDV